MQQTILRAFALALLSVIALTSCQVHPEDPAQNQTLQAIPPQAHFVAQDLAALFQRFENAAENEVIAFDLANGSAQNWRVEAWRDDFLAADFAGSDGAQADAPVLTGRDMLTLTGKVVGQEVGEVSLVLTRKLLGGSVTLPSETYLLSPPQDDRLRGSSGFMLEAASEQAPVSGAICDAVLIDGAEVQTPSGDVLNAARAAASCSKIQIRANGDFEYYRDRAGSNLNVAIFAIALTLHEASKKFATVGNVLELQGTVVFTSPSNPFYYPTSNSIYTLLDQTRDFHNFFFPNPNAAWDGVLLFTGKNTSPSTTIGLAYLGAVCKYNGAYSYGVVEVGSNATVNINTTAHEIGHITGAGHTDAFTYASGCRTNSIMEPFVSSSSNARFTSCSRDQILFHRFFHNACMSPGTCTQ